MMENKTVRLEVPYEKAGLSSEGCSAELDLYPIARHENIEITRRPAVIICPGGGYEYCSVREAEPIALRYAAYGVAAFVLRYSCVNKKFPTALLEAAQAMAYVRKNAEELGVDPDKIMICGFSAGGHLAASLAVHWNKSFITDALGGDRELYKPNGTVLCYPVITSGEKRHDGSIVNIAGESPSAEMLETLSLEKQVTKDTPPTFLWHTADDGCVPVENTLMFASALAAEGIPFACHIFKEGVHGLALCDDTTAGYEGHINPDCARWFEMSVQWIKAL
ncbi:MAG: alpha/beta hydrolase [Oscillospiraceae bacterium]|nr:alpha/beta hydrolase [Oscillospiraceae bacterium]